MTAGGAVKVQLSDEINSAMAYISFIFYFFASCILFLAFSFFSFKSVQFSLNISKK